MHLGWLHIFGRALGVDELNRVRLVDSGASSGSFGFGGIIPARPGSH